ncbi:MAG: hypothetical protein WCA77_10010 [Thermoplasmata archaeon]
MRLHASPSAEGLLRSLREEHPTLYLLIDDSGYSGPGHVSLQTHSPAPDYMAAGAIADVGIYVHLGFRAALDANDFLLEAQSHAPGDTFSLETTRQRRFFLDRLSSSTQARSGAHAEIAE